nr:MAG TPA: hypothetical protein [Caudoviricetes sp.]
MQLHDTLQVYSLRKLPSIILGAATPVRTL